MDTDLRVAELASLLEIDVEEARTALAEAGGDVAAAVEVIRNRSGAHQCEQPQTGAPPACQEQRYEWAGGGCSVLSPSFGHVVHNEPVLHDMLGTCELRALGEYGSPKDLLPVLCEMARVRRSNSGQASTALFQRIPERSATSLSIASISLECQSVQGVALDESGVSREEAIRVGRMRLSERLDNFNLCSLDVEDDGNCLFRACAAQIYRDAKDEHHPLIRHRAVSEMHRCAAKYSVYFGSEAEFVDYLATMSYLGTWGDELVLRAVADAYGVTAHVITSTVDNWYLVYAPEKPCSGRCRHLFLTYLSPIHYNGFEAMPLAPSDVKVHVLR